MFKTVLALAVLLLATAAQAATLPATPQTVAAVARSAQACDVVAITGAGPTLQFGSPVAPVVAFPVSAACPWGVTFDLSALKLTWFEAAHVANLRIHGGTFAASDWHGAVFVTGFSNVTVEGITQTSGLQGIAMRDGQGASVQGNSLTGGVIYIGGVTGFDVGYNVSLSAAGDGVDVAGSSNGRVHHNTSVGTNALNGIHPDPVQVFGAVPPYPVLSSRIEIDHNYAVGHTMGYDTWDGGGARIWIHDNYTVNGNVNGAIHNCTGCAATNNRGATLPGSGWQAGTIDSRGSPDAIICGNTAESFSRWPAINGPACTSAQLAAAAALVAP